MDRHRLRTTRWAGLAGLAAIVILGTPHRPLLARQRHQEHSAAAANQGAPPTPQHALLRRLAGVWSARIEEAAREGEKTAKARGTETNRICCGGQFLVIDLVDRSRETPRGGGGVLGYDPGRGRYILAWAGARSTALVRAEGDYRRESDTLVFRYEGPDGHGGTRTMREVFAWDGPDRRSRTVYAVGPGGSESEILSITYRKR